MILASLAAPTGAQAAYDAFMNEQGLSAGNAYASNEVHNKFVRIYAASDHTVCPAIATGYSGYTNSPNGGGRWTGYSAAYCAPTYTSMPLTPANDWMRGAVWNKNMSTYDYIDYAGAEFNY